MRCNLRWGITLAMLAAVATLAGGSGVVLRADPADAVSRSTAAAGCCRCSAGAR
jgi:hypothetical protein